MAESPLHTAESSWSESIVQTVDAPAHLRRLADATRAFMEAQMRADVDVAIADDVASRLEHLTRRLRSSVPDRTPGDLFDIGGPLRNDFGNAVVGRRNPVAPPMTVHRLPDGRARAELDLGCLYEGAPGQVHGGVCAMLLDQLLGEAAGAGGNAGMTVYLTTTFKRITKLGHIRLEAWTASVDGRKAIVRGHLADGSGATCIEAEALFIMPRSHVGTVNESSRGEIS